MGLYLIAANSFWTSPNSYLAMLMVAVGLGAVIFVHELGHFLVAKACGVKCEKFYVGFDFFDIKIAGRVIIPRALVKFRHGETEYGIGIVPLGGYVKMLGQDDDPTKYSQEMERAKRKATQPTECVSHLSESLDTPAGEQAERSRTRQDDTSPGGPVSGHTVERADQKAGHGSDELDPRSYQAKTVWQRMMIISAGVIMNLIFAVIFASIAFRLGVSYTPCEIGSTVAGGPAWTAGLNPGDRIVQIGRQGEPRRYIRFTWDLAQTVAAHGDQSPIDFLVERVSTGRQEWLSIFPSREVYTFDDNASIGVQRSLTTTLSAGEPTVVPYLAAAMAGNPFRPNDKIVAIDGAPIESIHEMKRILARRPDETLTFTVERRAGETGTDPWAMERVDVRVPPTPVRHLGLEMNMGPVSALQQDSPAARAGFQLGDLIQTVDGQPVGDPLTLSHRLRKRAGESVVVTVLRNRNTEQLTVVPQLPLTSPTVYPGRPIAIDEIGVAIPVLNVVARVEPQTAAHRSGLRSGDQITKVEFLPASDEKRIREEREIGLSHKPIDLEKEGIDWPLAHERMQSMLPDSKVRLTFVRGSEVHTAEMLPEASEQWSSQTRGMLLQPKEEEFQAASWMAASQFGLRQTWEDATRVVGFLRKLLTGSISPTNLGGPASIAVVATSEATAGPSRLLIFLTFLSANLAVVNFLPIPVLDGGHMVFLTYELITRRKPSERWFVGLSIFGLAFILSLMLFVIGLDVFRFANFFSSG